jgi:hypothetical protein
MVVVYKKISSDELKETGKVINGERHIPEGLYTTHNPEKNCNLKEKIKADLEEKETT